MPGIRLEGGRRCRAANKAGERKSLIRPGASTKALDSEERPNAKLLFEAHQRALVARARICRAERAIHIARSPESKVGCPATRDVPQRRRAKRKLVRHAPLQMRKITGGVDGRVGDHRKNRDHASVPSRARSPQRVCGWSSEHPNENNAQRYKFCFLEYVILSAIV